MSQPVWMPTRAAGLEQLAAFLPRAGRSYATQRNYDFGPEDRSNVSCLSPWLRHRLITEEEVLRATLEHHEFAAAQSFIQEVFWRTYFKGWLEHHPYVWDEHRAGLANAETSLQGDDGLRADVAAACSGQTGIACFDGWVGELIETGYLHNHARMWFASIWIFTLKLPWHLGADFFLRHLIDGDPASNTLSWRWVVGLHTKGKTYRATAENITRFTEGRFGDADRLDRLLSDVAEPLDEELTGREPRLSLPAVQEVPARFGLIVMEDDCWGKVDALPQAPAAILPWCAVSSRSPGAVSTAVKAFSGAAIGDGVMRVCAGMVEECVPASPAFEATSLVEWAQGQDLSCIVLSAPPVGYAADALASEIVALEAADVAVVGLYCFYDRLVWPYANRGFFKLRKKIPKLLANLGLPGE